MDNKSRPYYISSETIKTYNYANFNDSPQKSINNSNSITYSDYYPHFKLSSLNTIEIKFDTNVTLPAGPHAENIKLYKNNIKFYDNSNNTEIETISQDDNMCIKIKLKNNIDKNDVIKISYEDYLKSTQYIYRSNIFKKL